MNDNWKYHFGINTVQTHGLLQLYENPSLTSEIWKIYTFDWTKTILFDFSILSRNNLHIENVPKEMILNDFRNLVETLQSINPYINLIISNKSITQSMEIYSEPILDQRCIQFNRQYNWSCHEIWIWFIYCNWIRNYKSVPASVWGLPVQNKIFACLY